MMASSYNAKDEDGHITVSGPGGGALRSKKPENTAFKQQRLPAWQPILTAGTVLPAFFIIGLIFIPIGIGLYVTSNNIKEFEVTFVSRRQRTGTTPGLSVLSVAEDKDPAVLCPCSWPVLSHQTPHEHCAVSCKLLSL